MIALPIFVLILVVFQFSRILIDLVDNMVESEYKFDKIVYFILIALMSVLGCMCVSHIIGFIYVQFL